MPVPFGISIGDFIALIEAAVTVINACKESTGSVKEYENVIRELESLRLALGLVQDVTIQDPQVKAALESVAFNCERTVREFLDKIQKYEIFTTSSTFPRDKWKRGLRKIQWALYSKDDVRLFESQLQAHTASLNILLWRVSHNSSTTSHNTQNVQRDALIRIETKLDKERKQIAAMQAMILSALTTCWTEFRALVAFILFTNFHIFDCKSGKSRMPVQITFDQPVTFEDAHGRFLPIQMAWIDSWENFETMLKWKFADVPGLRKIESQEYVLSDVFNKRDVDRSRTINTVFRPGRSFNMSMCFELALEEQQCPKCSSSVLEAPSRESHCTACGLWYSRLRSIRDTTAGVNGLGSSLGVEYLAISESESKRIETDNYEHTDMDLLSDFHRVRILELDDIENDDDHDSLDSDTASIWSLSSGPRRGNEASNPPWNPSNEYETSAADSTDMAFVPRSVGPKKDSWEESPLAADPSEQTSNESRAESFRGVGRESSTEDTASSWRAGLASVAASSYWSIPETRGFREHLAYFGTNWTAIASHMGTKTPLMVKNYYMRHVDSNRSDLARTAALADQRNERGENVDPPPAKIPLAKRPYEGPRSAVPSPPAPDSVEVRNSSSEEPPQNARWTKIDRRLVNPEALDEAGERYEYREDYLIVLRPLPRDRIQQLADRTKEIRVERNTAVGTRSRTKISLQSQTASSVVDTAPYATTPPEGRSSSSEPFRFSELLSFPEISGTLKPISTMTAPPPQEKPDSVHNPWPSEFLLPRKMDDLSESNTSSHEWLQKYKLQLMLLEQQNMKRLGLARQEHDRLGRVD